MCEGDGVVITENRNNGGGMRETIVHKINQVIHIIILSKGDTPTKLSL
jgi:hypothetical protein